MKHILRLVWIIFRRGWIASDTSLVEDGVQIEQLTLEAVEDLSGEAHSVADLSGVSVVTESSYGPDVIADALTQVFLCRDDARCI